MNIRIQENYKSLLRCAVLCLAFAFATSMKGASLKGDIDNNGEINVNDISAMVGHILGSTQDEPPIEADLDGDGVIGINDVLILVELILEGERGPIGDGGDANPGYPVLAPRLNIGL